MSVKTNLVFFLSLVLMGYNLSFAQPGSLDSSFDSGTGANDWVSSTSIQNDGKIIVVGYFTSYNGTARNHIARVNADGSLDTSFDPGTGANGPVQAISIQSDGKIIIVGHFTSYNGTSINRIARLNTNGNLDTSFDPGTGANDHIWTASLQSDGKIIICGMFTSYNGTARNDIARLNTNGSLDTSFNPGTGAGMSENAWIYSAATQSDGKIIIGGEFTSYNGTAINHIARLHTDGSLDASFDPGPGADTEISTTSIQSDGKIIIGGHFTSYNGIVRNRIARLNADGSLDTYFDPGTGANHAIWHASVQSDGKIIIVGQLTNYDGTARNHIARLHADGSLDTSFDPGTGANHAIWNTSTQSDGKIIINGYFTLYDGMNINHIARLNALTTGIDQPGKENGKIKIFPNPFSSNTKIQTEFDLRNATLTIFNSSGQSVKQIPNVSGSTTFLNRDNLPSGLYFIRFLQDSEIIMTDKIIITD